MSAINGTGAADSLTGSSGVDTIRGLGGDDTIRGGGSADSLLGGEGADLIIDIGDGWGDTLRGEAGDDTLLGGGDGDVMYGGDGSDVVAIGSGDYGNGEAGDDIIVAAPLPEEVVGMTMAVGGEGADLLDLSLYGYSAVVWLDRFQTVWDGFYGYSLEGVLLGDHDSTVWGGGAQDLIVGGAGDDDLNGGDKRDLLSGGMGDDRISGDAGNDIIAASPGWDHVDGGAGVDQIHYFDATAGVTVDLEGSGWTAEFGYETLTSIEQLAGSQFGDSLYAGSGDDTILGQGGDDRIQASTGVDLLDGGEGVDTVVFSSADLQGVSGLFDLGAQTVTLTGGSVTHYLSFEIVDGTSGNDTAIATVGDDVFSGGNGFDTITYAAAAGAITLSFSVLEAQDTGASGFDKITQVDEVIGSAFDDRFQAGFYAQERLRGEAGDDTLVGTGGTDSLWGGDGDDVISGLTVTGNYFIDGGAGTDTVTFGAAREGVSVRLGVESAQTVGAATYRLGSIEKVVGSKFADVFAGATGMQAVDGGKGDDLLTFAAAKRGAVLDMASGGVTGVERVEGSAFRDALTGDAAGNRIDGLAGADVLSGGGGKDVLSGGQGDDLVMGGKGDDQLSGGDGLDTVSFADSKAAVRVNLGLGRADVGLSEVDGISGFENVTGGKGADRITGDGAANRLTGGGGADRLEGGGGNDVFVYAALADSKLSASDLIVGLQGGDVIDLSAIDANAAGPGEGDFVLVDSFGRHAGEAMLRYDAGKDVTRLYLDVDGDARADALITLDGDHTDFTGFVW